MEKNFRIEADEDFVVAPRFDNSLRKMLQKFPDGVEMKVAAKVLQMTEEQAKAIYDRGISRMRSALTALESDSGDD